MSPFELRVCKMVVALIWLSTGIISLWIYPVEDSLALLARVGFDHAQGELALIGAGSLDIVLGLLTLCYPRRGLWLLQGVLIVVYTLLISVFLPEYWLHPFGPILKNLAVLLLLWLLFNNRAQMNRAQNE